MDKAVQGLLDFILFLSPRRSMLEGPPLASSLKADCFLEAKTTVAIFWQFNTKPFGVSIFIKCP